MPLRIWLVLCYIAHCLWRRVGPWRFFQLNSAYFNEQLGLYSKRDMDRLIPDDWRLAQQLDDGQWQPPAYPVFYKPEWGQNGSGIVRIDNDTQLAQQRARVAGDSLRYLIQEAAPAAREFELFVIHPHGELGEQGWLSVVEVRNRSGQAMPVNSVLNADCSYHDISERFDPEAREQLRHAMGQIRRFRMARFCLRCEDEAALLRGAFKVVEINLFLPMPLCLLDQSKSLWQRYRLASQITARLAEATQNLPWQPRKRVFFRKIAVHYRGRVQ